MDISTWSKILLLKKENESLIETVTDLQVRSMNDNLIITGVAETLNENVEEQVRTFFQKQLDMNKEEAEEITFVRVHRMGKKKNLWRSGRPHNKLTEADHN